MLKIWYYANIEYMKDAPSYFDNVYEDEWKELQLDMEYHGNK